MLMYKEVKTNSVIQAVKLASYLEVEGLPSIYGVNILCRCEAQAK